MESEALGEGVKEVFSVRPLPSPLGLSSRFLVPELILARPLLSEPLRLPLPARSLKSFQSLQGLHRLSLDSHSRPRPPLSLLSLHFRRDVSELEELLVFVVKRLVYIDALELAILRKIGVDMDEGSACSFCPIAHKFCDVRPVFTALILACVAVY